MVPSETDTGEVDKNPKNRQYKKVFLPTKMYSRHSRGQGHLIQWKQTGEGAMKEYTAKEMKLLKANPYTFKVTKNKLYFTAEFKENFWTAYQAGMAPRNILEDLGYDLEMFGQKQIDSIVQRIKSQALSGNGFRQEPDRSRRIKEDPVPADYKRDGSQETLNRIWNEVKYLRQEVDFLKKIIKTENTAKRKH